MTITDRPEDSLAVHGLRAEGRVLRNPTTSQLYAAALDRGEAVLAEDGPLVVDTGRFTGRSPKDKFIVREPGSEDRIWWSETNAEISEEHFDGLRAKVVAHLETRDVYVIDAFCGADPKHRLSVRVLTTHPYHALFAKTMFSEPAEADLADFEPDVLVLHEPDVEADPAHDGTRTEVFICLHPSRKEILIGGTFYGGEIKKSVFTLMNDQLPLEGVMPMHCSANVSQDGRDVAVFFGLSGTGKTTLSADPERLLIGDDEHGWGNDGVFNFEGGCYAKTIRLSADAEPEIWKAVHSFGTVLENVAVDERGVLDLDDDAKTENTRAAYKLEQIANALPAKRAGHPRSVIFLAADAFGILPPIARLSREQALFFFLSGYTSKLAGTELGVTEPQPTFSTCFGAPFWPQRPGPPDADPGHTRAARLGAHGRARRRRVPDGPGLRLRGSHACSGRRRVAARPALDVGGSRGVRPQGTRARADVRRQLRDEARRRSGRGRGGRTEAVRLNRGATASGASPARGPRAL